MNSAVDYRKASQECLAHAEWVLSESDYRPASDELWGAVSEVVNTVAGGRNWSYSRHARLFTEVSRLAGDAGDQEMPLLFRATRVLHMNFDERLLPARDVQRAFGEVERLIEQPRVLQEVAA